MDVSVTGEGLLSKLQERSWRIERSASRESFLPLPVRWRYPRLPVELTSFLGGLESCVNQDENVWFLCRSDYRRTDGLGFRWNEYELMSLEAAGGDSEWQAQIRGFWDRHFPLMLAVHSDYDYLAVSLEDGSYGAVVHGFGPDFEEGAAVVASSFQEFLALFEQVAGGAGEYPLSFFL